MLSNLLHLLTAILVLLAAYWSPIDWLHWLGVGIFISLLTYQHFLVKPNDLSKVNLAFFTTNGIASALFSIFVIVDLFW